MYNLYNLAPVWMQNVMVSSYGVYLKRLRYGGRYDSCFKRLLDAPWECRQDFDELEARMLQRMIRHCYENVPYYRGLFDDYGIQPSRIQDRNDLRNIPLLEKEEVRRNPEQFLSKNVGRRGLHIAYTSGSTGTPIKLYQSDETIQWLYACHSIVRRWAEIGAGARRASFGGRLVVHKELVHAPFWRFNLAENQLLFSSYHLNERNLPQYADRLVKFQPAEIIGYPSAIYLIARHLLERNIATVRPIAVLTNSETLYSWHRETIEKAFHCPVFDWYCSEEFLFFGSQCKERSYYHLFPYAGIIEIIGQPNLAVDEPGEVVATSLLNYGMPLLRYRIGDEAIASGPQESCACGRKTPLLLQVQGRTDDVIVGPDGSLIGRMDHVYKGLQHIVEGQIIQERQGQIRVLVHRANGYSTREEKQLIANIRARVGSSIGIHIEYVETIPRSRRGKFKGVLSTLMRLPDA